MSERAASGIIQGRHGSRLHIARSGGDADLDCLVCREARALSPLLLLIVGLVLGELGLRLCSRFLEVRASRAELPRELRDQFEPAQISRSREYLTARIRFSILVDLIETPALLAFLVFGGFGWLDRLIRLLGLGPIATGLLFLGAIGLASAAVSLPAAAYRTFSIEQRFGFNRTTLRTFALDRLRNLVLSAALGGPLLAVVLSLFETLGPSAWLLCFGAVALFQLGVTYVAPTWLMPLYNRFAPLPGGPLREALEAYARTQAVPVEGIYTVDGSRRSSKANAFFVGFGRTRRIALYDTLINAHPVEEIEAVLAHEVGHLKLRHTHLGLLVSLLTTGCLCFLFSLLLAHPGISAALAFGAPSVHGSLLAFGLLLAPVEVLLGLLGNAWSRQMERAADAFAARTIRDPGALAAALLRLSASNLSNLNPHPFTVALYHRHPPLSARVRRLRDLETRRSA